LGAQGRGTTTVTTSLTLEAANQANVFGFVDFHNLVVQTLGTHMSGTYMFSNGSSITNLAVRKRALVRSAAGLSNAPPRRAPRTASCPTLASPCLPLSTTASS
jgi:hypothetical protein